MPIHVTRLYSKNRHCDRVKRSRRQHYFFNKRLEQDSMKEPAEFQRVINTQRIMMSNIFGQPMSQTLGDGGIISNMNRASDKVAHVKKYFGIPDNASAEVSECCERVARNPSRTHGEFEGKESIMRKTFYRPVISKESDEEFNRVADYKEGEAPAPKEVGKHEHSNRYYSGLFTEIAFKNLSERHMNELRRMEIDAKQGRFNVSAMYKREELQEDGEEAEYNPAEDFPFLEGKKLE